MKYAVGGKDGEWGPRKVGPGKAEGRRIRHVRNTARTQILVQFAKWRGQRDENKLGLKESKERRYRPYKRKSRKANTQKIWKKSRLIHATSPAKSKCIKGGE